MSTNPRAATGALLIALGGLQPQLCHANDADAPGAAPAQATVATAPAHDSEAIMNQAELGAIFPLRPFQTFTAVNVPIRMALGAESVLQEQAAAQTGSASGFAVGSAAAKVGQIVNAANVGLARSVADKTDTALLGAMIVFDVMDAWLGAKSDHSILKDSYEEILRPSLHFISLKMKEAERDDKVALDQHFQEATQILRDVDLGCEPSHFKSTAWIGGKYITRGYFVPGHYHRREYVCGYPAPAEVSGFALSSEKRTLEVVIFPKGEKPSPYDESSLARVAFDRLKFAKGIQKMVDPDGTLDKEDLPQRVYERIKGKLGPNWYAVYTIKSTDKQRHVMVVKGDQQIELIVPEVR